MEQIDLTNIHKKKSPFKVPEGYFDNFVEKMMARIPEKSETSKQNPVSEPKVTLFARIKPYLYLAAMISGLAFGIKVYKYQQQYYSQKHQVAANVTYKPTESYVDDLCDFAMIDDHDVFACATNDY